MCAINGFTFCKKNLIGRMNKVTSHRGPDDTGVYLDQNISLGHNRLSIIDLSSAAHQPMRNKNLVIVYNGELYNFLELKKELQDSYQFVSCSDTEVILAAYQKWGKDCVKKLNGMFAFAIWNIEKKELFLARDHVGIKPLYYFWDKTNFIFSSEIKAILAHGMRRKVNKKALSHYLRVLYVPEPLTMFEGISKLPPAHFALFCNNTLTLERYWDAGGFQAVSKKSRKELAEELHTVVKQAVGRQLVSDKPLGVYLSGGIDSSAVLHSMAGVHTDIKTFSVGFELTKEEQREKFNKDFELARETAKHYGTNHHEVLLSSDEVVDLFQKIVHHLDEPISNATAIAQFTLASFAKGSVDVVLGGDGGDELFGGYERYRLSLLADYYQRSPRFFRNVLHGFEKLDKLNTPPGIERFALFMFQKDEILKRVVAMDLATDSTKDFFNDRYNMAKSESRFREQFLEIDRKSWLVDESLMRTDKMAMAHGLEVRVPLLDKEIVEFSHRVPFRYKVSSYSTKIILKDAFKGYIPDILYKQPKRGWFSPAAKWLRHERVHEFVEEVLQPGFYRETEELFKWEDISVIVKDHYERREYNVVIIWALLTFQIWARHYRVKI